MKLHRIYTENKNLDLVKTILNESFDSYTLIETTGSWNSVEEKGLIIEVVDDIDDPTYLYVAKQIKDLNKQEAVLTTTQEVKSELI